MTAGDEALAKLAAARSRKAAVDTKLLLTKAQRRTAMDLVRAQFTAQCPGPLSKLSREAIAALEAEARAQEAATVDDRDDCGADLNALVVDGPWDGQQHAAPCLRCGRQYTWVAPVFDPARVEEAPGEKDQAVRLSKDEPMKNETIEEVKRG